MIIESVLIVISVIIFILDIVVFETHEYFSYNYLSWGRYQSTIAVTSLLQVLIVPSVNNPSVLLLISMFLPVKFCLLCYTLESEIFGTNYLYSQTSFFPITMVSSVSCMIAYILLR